jgi:quinol monooxygenase YgiN
MYSRHVTFNLKPSQQDLAQMFEREILPLLQKQNGFTDAITLVSPDKKNAIVISLWERKENADAYARDAYAQVLKSLVTVVDGTPEVRGFEVVFSSIHKTAATR